MPAATPSLFLITPLIGNADFAPDLETALKAAPFASVWLRFGAKDEREQVLLAKQFVLLVQRHNAAALVESADPRFASRCGADGLHARFSDDAIESHHGVRPEKILGFGGLKQRDDAMTAGEQADYVMFGEPAADSYVPPLATTVERCRWWVELFETPCVAYAASLEAVTPLAGTHAEFVALGAWVFEADTAATIRNAYAALSAAPPLPR